jgi:hypothetical protein
MTSFPLISGVFAPSFTHSADSSARDGNAHYLLVASSVTRGQLLKTCSDPVLFIFAISIPFLLKSAKISFVV